MNENKMDKQWHRECAFAHYIRQIPGMGIKTIERLYSQYGRANGYEGVYRALCEAVGTDENQLGLDQRQICRLKIHLEEKEVKQEYQKLLYNKIWCIPRYLYGYPDKLHEINDPPAMLYIKGKLPDWQMPVVAVVGARNCSPYGRLVAKELGRKLAQNQIQVISGLARGIDGIGQRSAMESGGATFGVLGCGVDICYPEENTDIYKELAIGRYGGGIISEYPPGTQPASGLFPMRNRIISALSDVLVVVEARQRSGTFITVTNALEQGKDVYVVPGRVDDSLSYGCNRLIGQGAGVIYDIEVFIREVLDRCAYINRKECYEGALPDVKEQKVDINAVEDCVYRSLDIQYRSAEQILAEAVPQLPMPQGLAVLATLECLGLAESEGSFYRKSDNIM